MNSTFDIVSVNTCSPAYSWDDGNPTEEGEIIASSVSSNNEEGTQYIGYAPYVIIALSSDPGPNPNVRKSIVRTVDFGDYYNTSSNNQKDTTYDNVFFTHVYVMPGIYTISIEQIEYAEVIVSDSVLDYGRCFQKHCVDWTWRNLNTTLNDGDPALSDFKWKFTKQNQKYQKRWLWEPCNEPWALGNAVYTQKTQLVNKHELGWQWYNFSSVSPENPFNTSTPWVSTGFMQPSQLDWNQTTGPCLNLFYQDSDIIWHWNHITTNAASIGRYADNITWDETRLQSPKSVTWDYVSNLCYGTTTGILLSTSKISKTKTAVIKVLEIPPVAYLKATNPTDIFQDITEEEKISPLTVKLTPRFTTAGSFPIERIDWDLGDGSPILTQRRWSPTLQAPFVFTGQIEADFQDPRNYDVIHTYKRTPNTGFSFYPSITAYASSTGSSDSAACIIGPLRYPDPSDVNFVLLQNELTDHGKVLIGQINQNTVVWKADK